MLLVVEGTEIHVDVGGFAAAGAGGGHRGAGGAEGLEGGAAAGQGGAGVVGQVGARADRLEEAGTVLLHAVGRDHVFAIREQRGDPVIARAAGAGDQAAIGMADLGDEGDATREGGSHRGRSHEGPHVGDRGHRLEGGDRAMVHGGERLFDRDEQADAAAGSRCGGLGCFTRAVGRHPEGSQRALHGIAPDHLGDHVGDHPEELPADRQRGLAPSILHRGGARDHVVEEIAGAAQRGVEGTGDGGRGGIGGSAETRHEILRAAHHAGAGGLVVISRIRAILVVQRGAIRTRDGEIGGPVGGAAIGEALDLGVERSLLRFIDGELALLEFELEHLRQDLPVFFGVLRQPKPLGVLVEESVAGDGSALRLGVGEVGFGHGRLGLEHGQGALAIETSFLGGQALLDQRFAARSERLELDAQLLLHLEQGQSILLGAVGLEFRQLLLGGEREGVLLLLARFGSRLVFGLEAALHERGRLGAELLPVLVELLLLDQAL